MRIAYICADPGIPVFGQKGCSIHVQEVLRALKKKGAEIELFTVRTGGNAPHDLQDIKVHLLPPLPKGDPGIRERAAIELNQKTFSVLQNLAAFDMIYERYSLWSYAGMEYAQSQTIPGILEVNAPLIEEQEKHRSLIHRQEAENIARRTFASASSLIAVSDEVADYLIRFSGTAIKSRVHVIANGINPERFRTMEKQNDHHFVVGFVGTLKPWHGLSYLLQAFADFKHTAGQVRLLIVGDGPQREEIETLALQLDIADVLEMTGAVEPERIPTLLKQMDVAVAPYPEMNNFYFSPLKVYEYMAAKTAVIASDIGQIKQLIDDRVNGLLIEPGNVTALSNALQMLYRQPELRRSLAMKGRDTVLKDYTWDIVAGKILELARSSQQTMMQAG